MEMYAAGARGGLPTLLSLMAKDVVAEEPGFVSYGGTYRTPDGLADLFEKVRAVLDVTSLRVDYLVPDGARVFGVVRLNDIATGREVLLAKESIIRDGLGSRTFFY